MPDYRKLRNMVSHRVTFEYDTGIRVVGYLASCAPVEGQVALVNLSKASIIDGEGKVLADYAELPVVANNLVGFRVTEGPL